VNIAIIGAGIGGLSAAACLLKRGHAVSVYEQANALGEVGAGIQMSANATKVLNSIGLGDTLEAIGVKPQAFEFRRFDTGEHLHRIPIGTRHTELHGATYYQVHRGDLHAALVDAVSSLAPDCIKLNMPAKRVEDGQKSACVHFANGSSIEADLVVGADGIKSVVRKAILGDDQPEFTGHVAWRLIVPTERIAPQLRTDVVSTVWCGPKNHAVSYYIRSGTLVNFVGCVARPWEEESWIASRPWEELDIDYAGWHPMVRAIVEAADKDKCYRWALNNRKPASVWSSKHITLLGDAVHATLPYMAQGAAMAIEDAAILSRALEIDLPLDEALLLYQDHRAPRTARVVYESTEMGSLYQIVDADEMRKQFHERNIAKSRNEWLYPYDPLTVNFLSTQALSSTVRHHPLL
jgi:salicylate hydroxylase